MENGLNDYIRACSAISTLHIAVEELILNSIDADSTRIEIFIGIPELKNFSVICT